VQLRADHHRDVEHHHHDGPLNTVAKVGNRSRRRMLAAPASASSTRRLAVSLS
jgi:hypothetical protein